MSFAESPIYMNFISFCFIKKTTIYLSISSVYRKLYYDQYSLTLNSEKFIN